MSTSGDTSLFWIMRDPWANLHGADGFLLWETPHPLGECPRNLTFTVHFKEGLKNSGLKQVLKKRECYLMIHCLGPGGSGEKWGGELAPTFSVLVFFPSCSPLFRQFNRVAIVTTWIVEKSRIACVSSLKTWVWILPLLFSGHMTLAVRFHVYHPLSTTFASWKIGVLCPPHRVVSFAKYVHESNLCNALTKHDVL